jgi:hypothetical protein
MLKGARTNVRDEMRSSLSSVVTDNPVQNVDQKFCEIGASQLQGHSCEFPQISRLVVYEMITG